MEKLKSIKVKIFYDEEFKKITGKDFEESVVSENLGLPMFLNFIFNSYSFITKKFFPGTLGFLLNKKPPKDDDILKDGDELKIIAKSIEEMRKEIELQIREIIEYYEIDITFEKIREMVFIENNQKDFNNLIDIFSNKITDFDKLNAVMQVVNGVWNYFPHESLDGLCPMEKLINK